MLNSLAFIVVVLTGLYFLTLGAGCLFYPQQGARFLGGFAATPFRHYTEMLVRLLVGSALVIYAPAMFASSVFTIFGWVIIITSVVLCLLPWRWHQRFAATVVPPALRHLKMIGVCSLALGLFLFWSLIHGRAG